MAADTHNGAHLRNTIELLFYLAGGWRSYKDISQEFGWAIQINRSAARYQTAYRHVRALEEAGLPIERLRVSDEGGSNVQRMRLPPDWVARTPWLRRYIMVDQPAVERPSRLLYRR